MGKIREGSWKSEIPRVIINSNQYVIFGYFVLRFVSLLTAAFTLQIASRCRKPRIAIRSADAVIALDGLQKGGGTDACA